jgi:hypothetical protein
MRPGVPFIAPRQLGAVGGKHGRPSLPSVEWRTGQSGAPPDSCCSLSGARFPSKSSTVDCCSFGPIGAPDSPVPPADRWHDHVSREDCAADHCAGDRWLTGQYGAHRTVRCPLPTVGATTCRAKIAQPTVGAGDRGLTGQSGAPQDSPMIFSRTPPSIPESSTFTGDQPGAPDTVRCTTGQLKGKCAFGQFLLCFGD